ncbi:MAG TPA: histidine kinase dimerization/phosphoacceptor domain -containing protein [Bryobacteraceae bacterium]|nr:histidine kinase dimerization/phosphoacceptor domain -containing protein [Bryobacteraceae bacterium]
MELFFTTPRRLNTMKLLMVDDSEAERRLFRILLEESLGPALEFWGESAGARGLETCRAVAPDCILLSYKLPDMTGLDFLARLRSDEGVFLGQEAAPPAVVMVTPLVDEALAVTAMRAGAQDYLIKDRMTPEGLGSVVDRAMQKMSLIRQIKHERDRLSASLAEKEVLLREVHHRVKNNLQVIASLLRLQASAFGDGALSAALRESQHRVESMALIHEQLYETDDLRDVDLAKHASLLLNNLLESYGIESGRIEGHVSLEPLPLGVDRAIPAGLILNELISNALKHAFPGGRRGSIWVEGGRGKGRIAVSVRDDGVGLPRGVELRRPKSLGLEIVNILTRQLKGELVVESGAGTAFIFSFPET